MKRVLVTGASGLIGSHVLAPLLARGFEVYAVTRRGLMTEDVPVYRVDLFDEKAAGALIRDVKPTHLLHLAWYAEHGRFWTAPENLRWVRASLALLEAFADEGGLRAVTAGSCAEYDSKPGFCSELVTRLDPTTLYGASKKALYGITDAYCRQIGLSWAWGRIFFLYGPGEHPNRLVSSVIRAMLHGERAETTHGEQLRDFMHVADVADAFAALVDTEVQGPVNIASGKPVRVKEVVMRIAELVGRRDLLHVGALADRPGDPKTLIADTERLRTEIGWVPRIELEDGLHATIEWWRERG
jgi:nucleoside-diphosphate-sugar epimerase